MKKVLQKNMANGHLWSSPLLQAILSSMCRCFGAFFTVLPTGQD